jgi:hypothetical protein
MRLILFALIRAYGLDAVTEAVHDARLTLA